MMHSHNTTPENPTPQFDKYCQLLEWNCHSPNKTLAPYSVRIYEYGIRHSEIKPKENDNLDVPFFLSLVLSDVEWSELSVQRIQILIENQTMKLCVNYLQQVATSDRASAALFARKRCQW